MLESLRFLLQSPNADLLYQSSYNLRLVALSVVVAIFGSYIALQAVPRITQANASSSKLTWIASGGVTMGLSTWAMHFIGMLALDLPCGVSYDQTITLTSMIPAILASGTALWVLGGSHSSKMSMALGSILLGSGIGTMHYAGMAAMKIEGTIGYNPKIFFLSIIVAIALAFVALQVRATLHFMGKWRDAAAALVMGCAISGMHYTAMDAAYFIKGTTPASLTGFAYSPDYLALMVVAITSLLALLSGLIAAAYQSDTAHKLRETEERWKFALDGAGDGVWDWDIAKDTLFFSQRWKDMMGCKEHDPMPNRTEWTARIHPDDREAVSQVREHCLKGMTSEFNFEYRVLCKNNVYKWILERGRVVVHGRDGRPLRMIGTNTDITVNKMAEEALQLHACVFKNASEGLAITDQDMRILSVNSAFLNVTGKRLHDVIGHPYAFPNFDDENQISQQSVMAAIEKVGHWHGEVWNRKDDGELYCEMLSLSAVKDKRGKITNYVGTFSDITDLKNTQNQLAFMANYDSLTGLPNRSLLTDRIQQNVMQARRKNSMVAVCYMDLDGFKPINDQYGRETGDILLKEVAKRLSLAIREGIDTIARLSGDEFVIVLSNLVHTDEIWPVIDRVLVSVTDQFKIGTMALHVSASIGITIYPMDNSDSDTLLRHSDAAMYQAKQMGRNRYLLFDPQVDEQMVSRHRLLEEIRQALLHDEFRLYYQPKVNLITGDVEGMEALIRWDHPEKGILPPIAFLPQIEATDLIVEIGDWVIDTALAQLDEWKQDNLQIAVSVNIAARQLQQADFIEKLEAALAKYPPLRLHQLELEILETTALEIGQSTERIFDDCKRLGVSVALDDFGTGYSSLTYLKKIPANTVKIDQSFVRDMLNDTDDQAIISSIIQLADVFGRQLIAEGVETDGHILKLVELGCTLAQGYGIAMPMPAAAVKSWVASHHFFGMTTHQKPTPFVV